MCKHTTADARPSLRSLSGVQDVLTSTMGLHLICNMRLGWIHQHMGWIHQHSGWIHQHRGWIHQHRGWMFNCGCFLTTFPSLRSRDILVKGRKHRVLCQQNPQSVKAHYLLVEGRIITIIVFVGMKTTGAMLAMLIVTPTRTRRRRRLKMMRTAKTQRSP